MTAESLIAEPGFDVEKCLKDKKNFFCLHKLFWPHGIPEGGYPDFVDRKKATGPEFKSLHIDYGEEGGSRLKTPDKNELPEHDKPGCEDPLNNINNPESLSAGEAANAEAIGRALGMSDKCIQTARDHLEVALRDKKAFSFLNLLGTAYDQSTTDHVMTSEGCGEFYSALQDTFSSMARLRCQFTNIKEKSTSTAVNRSTVRISVMGASAASGDAITEIIKGYQNEINVFMTDVMPDHEEQWKWYRKDPESYAGLMRYFDARLKGLQENLKYYTDQHPFEGNVEGSQIQINSKQWTNVTIMNEIRPEENANIKTEIETLATQSSIVKVQEEIGLGSLPPNARSFIEANAKQFSEEQAIQNMSILNQNKMTVTNDGEILLQIYGSMLGSTLIINNESEIDVKLQSTLASAVTLSEQVTNRIVSDLKAERTLMYKSEGITDVWGKIIAGATSRYNVSTISDTVYWIAIAVVVAVFAFFIMKT